jgi:hypothetical protein
LAWGPEGALPPAPRPPMPGQQMVRRPLTAPLLPAAVQGAPYPPAACPQWGRPSLPRPADTASSAWRSLPRPGGWAPTPCPYCPSPRPAPHGRCLPPPGLQKAAGARQGQLQRVQGQEPGPRQERERELEPELPRHVRPCGRRHGARQQALDLGPGLGPLRPHRPRRAPPPPPYLCWREALLGRLLQAAVQPAQHPSLPSLPQGMGMGRWCPLARCPLARCPLDRPSEVTPWAGPFSRCTCSLAGQLLHFLYAAPMFPPRTCFLFIVSTAPRSRACFVRCWPWAAFVPTMYV